MFLNDIWRSEYVKNIKSDPPIIQQTTTSTNTDTSVGSLISTSSTTSTLAPIRKKRIRDENSSIVDEDDNTIINEDDMNDQPNLPKLICDSSINRADHTKSNKREAVSNIMQNSSSVSSESST